MLANIADKFPATDSQGQPIDASPMYRVFFEQLLKQMNMKEILVAAAQIIEKVDGDTLLFINALTVKEAQKRGLMQSTP